MSKRCLFLNCSLLPPNQAILDIFSLKFGSFLKNGSVASVYFLEHPSGLQFKRAALVAQEEWKVHKRASIVAGACIFKGREVMI